MQIRRFLASHRDNIPNTFQAMDDVVSYLRRTVDVEHLELVPKADIGTGGGKSHPAWNIYIHPPTKDALGLQRWRELIRSITFVTLSNGAGTSYRSFHCLTCRSLNHPTGMCPYPDQKGWVKPTPPPPATASSSMTTPALTREANTPYRGGRGGAGTGRGRPYTPGRGRGSQRA